MRDTDVARDTDDDDAVYSKCTVFASGVPCGACGCVDEQVCLFVTTGVLHNTEWCEAYVQEREAAIAARNKR